MAANDYFNPSGPPQHKNDAPLPPTPGNHTQQSVSPVSSPFDDRPYPGQTHSSGALGGYPIDTSYSNTSYQQPTQYDSTAHINDPYARQPDPFADQNAIPLQNQQNQHKNDGDAPLRFNNDPEYYGMGVQPARKKSKKKKGLFSGRVTWVVYILTAVQVGVFIGELVKNGILTGSPIQTKPTFNIMIGPSPYVLINMGARFTPCMHNIRKAIEANPPVLEWPCPNTTTINADAPKCTLAELCGMGSGVPDQTGITRFDDHSREPNQWWRFITPIFLHAGLIHIGFNMLLQWTLGRDMEKEIGPLRFLLVYFSAGIFGFVLGGNYAPEGLTSVGCSGSLFGILALTMLDLLYNWSTRRSPVKDLLFLLLDMAIAFVIGLLPGLDNFSHIGGFCMGLVLGICIIHSPQSLRARTGMNEPPYATVDTQPLAPTAEESKTKISAFAKQPVGFFKGRKPLWWAWWVLRAGGLVAVFIGFILLLRNFYEWRNTCSWCKHLSCLPVKTNGVNWCDMGSLNFTSTTSTTPNKRALEPLSLAWEMGQMAARA
ncbi:GlpG membrane protein [Pyrenophora tritici-repentis]|uniref:Rhomboid-type serine protease n=2 Tax=Pyrenophora tritici-repentis TaxID=45151 RepID=A0A2W1F275_9PLEO|nr:rhomboid family membrane protein [Pyrenophora tritici-repentis Pt-1C-BFP]KAA8621688.1 Rhomboid-domain-containing protein [Pyrenophora tritici-repentis]EDU42987.1 rhomboid family membrane protein [Pyrenophora tritici-repentis Pt-1C-BFP]KAF7450914.1 Rhomboid-domain-containing protein [Pyrenophora tritici-repentis]KAF7573582.1 GlpG, membrane protein [Pyrenophora tritici-repentis]KAG9380878.1 Rhomboid-domain-containing protein [Pyrenophora tritici-repentis]